MKGVILMDSGEQSYRSYLSGDDNGMVELIRDYKDNLILYLNSYVDDIYIAEDLVQDTFIKLAVKKPGFRGKSSFKTWLFSIGRNIAYDYLRKNAGHKSISIDDCPDMESDTDIELECMLEERKIILYKSMQKLKADYRQVLFLTYFENFSNAEIAEIMHKTKRQVENLLYNAKKSIKSELERGDFEYEEL